MAQPGQPSARGDDWLVRKVQELEQRVQQLAAANVFGTTGITPQDGGTQFDGYVNVNGPMSITGTLNLPAGVIGNEALANPVATQVVNASALGFGLTSTLTQKISKTVTVPPGFTSAQVIAYADMTAVNSTAGGGYCFIKVSINGSSPAYSSGTFTPVGEFCCCVSNYSMALTGLGGSFTISAAAGTDGPSWAAEPDSNIINLNASVVFLR